MGGKACLLTRVNSPLDANGQDRGEVWTPKHKTTESGIMADYSRNRFYGPCLLVALQKECAAVVHDPIGVARGRQVDLGDSCQNRWRL